MHYLSVEKVARMANVVRDARGGSSFVERMAHVSESLNNVIPFTSLTAVLLRPDTLEAPDPGHAYNVGLDPDALKDYPTHYQTVDPCRHYCLGPGFGRATVLSRFLPDSLYSHEEFSADLLKPANIRHILGGTLPMPDGWVMLHSVQRAPGCDDFTKEDVRAMQILYPDVARAAFTSIVSERLAQGADTAGDGDRGAIVLDRIGDVVSADPAARRLLARVEGHEHDAGDVLLQGARRLLAPGTTQWTHTSTAPLRGGRSLRATFVRAESDGDVTVVLQELAPASREAAQEVSTRAGLTRREHFVALLAAGGLPNAEVGARLGIAPATVKVHLGRALRKVGVEGRTELAWALQGRRGPAPSPGGA